MKVRPFYQQILILAFSAVLVSSCARASNGSLLSRLANPEEAPAEIVTLKQPAVPQNAPSGQVEMVSQLGGQIKGVAVQGSYVYVGVGPRVIVLDRTNALQPTLVGQTPLLPSEVSQLYIEGTYIYALTNNAGLQVIDISNPKAPHPIGVIADGTSPSSVYLGEGRAYVVPEGQPQLREVAPAQGTSVVAAEQAPTDQATDFIVVGKYGYAVDREKGLQVINLANPAAPVVESNYAPPQAALDVALADGYAYVAAGQAGVRVVDVTNPKQSVEIGAYTALEAAVDVQVQNGIAYVIDPVSGLHLIDVTNPHALKEVGHYDTPGLANDLAVVNNEVYVTDELFGLYILDVSNKASPQVKSVYTVPQLVEDILIADQQTGYVAAGASGLWVMDLSNPAQPTFVKNIPLAGAATGLALRNQYLYVAAGDAGLQIVDISNRTAPVVVGGYDTDGSASAVAVVGTVAYVADEWAGLTVVDVADPTNPVAATTLELGTVRDVTAHDNLLYAAADEDDLWVIDIADEYSPAVVNQVSLPGDANSVAVSGAYAYLASGGAGLQIVDPTQPDAPAIGAWTQWYGRSITINGHFAYLATEQQGLKVFDITDPANPLAIGEFDTAGSVHRVIAAGDYLYVADSVGGLIVLKSVTGR